MSDTVVFVPWRDPLVESQGRPVLQFQVEDEWLPLVGPTAYLMLRRAVREVAEHDGKWAVRIDDLAGMLGVAGGSGKNDQVPRTLRRLCHFGLAKQMGGIVGVRFFVCSPTQARREAAQ